MLACMMILFRFYITKKQASVPASLLLRVVKKVIIIDSLFFVFVKLKKMIWFIIKIDTKIGIYDVSRW